MSRRTGASAKAQALAKATEAVARRDAERIEREKRLQATLAEFFQAQAEAEHIRAVADLAAVPFDTAMRDSVRALDGLGETRAGIASLTDLPLPRVREYLSGGADAACEDPPRDDRKQSSGVDVTATLLRPVGAPPAAPASGTLSADER